MKNPARALILPITLMDKGFDYFLPENSVVTRGQIARVSFGKNELLGVVMGEGESTLPDAKLKSVSTLFESPILSKNLLEFLERMASYTLTPLGEVFKLALPIKDFDRVEKKSKEEPLAEESAPKIPNLSQAQTSAAEKIAETIHSGFSVTVLEGVTGSGKTEVYFDAIARALESGGQVLLMLPEILLSVQLHKRIKERFGFAPTEWHSNLTPKMRRRNWKNIVSGEARLIVGARSALFLPFKNLSLIIVDEEHDGSYKQEEGAVYHARDMAVLRAHTEKIPILLVSATPSLETIYNIEQGKYQHLMLEIRYREAQLPTTELVDMNKEKLPSNHWISASLKTAIETSLKRGEQAMLFLNRRGYAPLTLCRKCGYRFQCPHCSSWQVMHHKHNMQCHHCGYKQHIPNACPECGEKDHLVPCGPGVERIAEEVAELFPTARALVLSSDTTAKTGEAEGAMQQVTDGSVDILIGTQMITKGHHFPRLNVVGVLDADMALEGGDPRGAEKCFQMLTQVAGRAGREQMAAEHAGLAIIQTRYPTHPLMSALVKRDKDGFIREELENRKRGGLPPYGKLAALILSGKKEAVVREAAEACARTAPIIKGSVWLGPAPAPLYKLNGRYRYRLLLKTPKSTDVSGLLKGWLRQMSVPSSVRLKVDIDPHYFL